MGCAEAGSVIPESLTPLGPSGVSQRMQEIQDKMRSMFGDDGSSNNFANSLDAQLGPRTGEPLSGTLGGGAPLDPSSLGILSTGGPQMKQMAIAAASKYGVDPDLFTALVNQESGFNPLARSKAGALGLTQLMPATAADMGVVDRADPAQSLDGGAKYLAKLLDQFGTPELALAAYNSGPNAVVNAGGIPKIPETQKYVQAILSQAAKRSNP